MNLEYDFDPQYIGSSFDDWLEAEGIAEEVHEAAIKELHEELIFKTLDNLTK